MDETQDANTGKVRNVTFEYKKIDENGAEKEVSLTVPILSIVPIPYVRLDEITIDFTAKLTDTIENVVKTGFKLDSSVGGTYKAWWSPIRLDFRTSMSYQSSRETASRCVCEYTIEIHARAVQDDMPAGQERVLDILEQTIKEKPKQP